jgi:hypothetical protein
MAFPRSASVQGQSNGPLAEGNSRAGGLKMPDLGPYDRPLGSFAFMFKRWVVIGSVIGFGLALSGCTKCGPIWDDWMQSPKSCKSDHF